MQDLRYILKIKCNFVKIKTDFVTIQSHANNIE